MKGKGCSEDENRWELPESLENGQELVEGFHKESPDMLDRTEVELGRKIFRM